MDNKNNITDLTSFIKQLQVIFISLLTGQIVFLGIVFYLTHLNGPLGQRDPQLENILTPVLIILVLVDIPIAYFLHGRNIKNILQINSIEEKLAKYKSSLLIKYALLEVVSLLCSMSFLLYGNSTFLILAAMAIIVFMMNKPSEIKIREEINLVE